jgi:hypothetical protein
MATHRHLHPRMTFWRGFLLSLVLLITMLTRSEPQPRVAPQSPPLPETQPFARPKSLNPNTAVLPPGYVGADPRSAVEWFNHSLVQIPITIDQYSTSAERAQFDRLRAQPFQSLGLLPFTLVESYQCKKTYNPDAQQFAFTLSPEITSSPPGLYKFTTAKVSVFKEEQPSSTDEASNAFGVRMTITQLNRKEISLAFLYELPDPYNLAPLRDEQKSLPRTKYTFSLPMAPSEARENDKDIRCLALFRPSPPYVYEYEDKRAPSPDGVPTMKFPWVIATKGTALFGKLEQLWVFHQRSGKIYTKVK